MSGVKGRSGKYLKTSEQKEKIKQTLMGHSVSDKTKEKISLANKGKKHDPIMVKARNLKISIANTGKKLSTEQKLKISKANKGKHPWNYRIGFVGDYSPEFTKKLKDFIIKRDVNTCQICNIPYLREKLVVHHIDYNKKNSNTNNLVCLCKTCHSKTNVNRNRWILYFSEKRKYLPSFSDLIDRLCISQMKEIFIPEHAEEYRKEALDISNDIDILIKEKNIKLNAKITWAILVIQLANRVIWENESKARAGDMDQDKLLKFTHSINGIRNTAKNIISQELGERVDLKIDCLAAELPKEFGNWDIFKKLLE